MGRDARQPHDGDLPVIRAAIALAFAVLAAPAVAQGNCAPRGQIVAMLAERYGEGRIGAGLDAQGRMVELFVSPDTGSWTALITRPDGAACIGAYGGSWQIVDEPVPQGEPG